MLNVWRIVLTFFLLILPHFAFAVSTMQKEPHWWEAVGGILAIPAAVLSLAYSYLLIKKTRLEAQKTELEIHEKEIELRKVTAGQSETTRQMIAPIIQSKQAQYLILRFVLLYVVLQLWSLVTSAWSMLVSGTIIGFQQVKTLPDFKNWWLIFLFLITSLPQAVTWVIVIGIGWPLMKDINTFLNVRIKDIIFPWRTRNKK